jgi:alkylation response protein AidB-like acyl-CoA dehydrogenase
MKWLRLIGCRLGWHRRLDVIQTFGAAQHIGCPDCRREMGIHHGVRTVVPWDSDLEQLYRGMGYDTETPTSRWYAFLERRAGE